MGVGINTSAAFGSVLGVSASKISSAAAGLGHKGAGAEGGQNQNIAQATDADKAEMAAATAKYQAEKLKTIKLRARQQQLKNKELRAKNRALREKQTLKKEEKPDVK